MTLRVDRQDPPVSAVMIDGAPDDLGAIRPDADKGGLSFRFTGRPEEEVSKRLA